MASASKSLTIPRWGFATAGAVIAIAVLSLAVMVIPSISGPHFVMEAGSLKDGCDGDAYYDHSTCNVTAVFKNEGGAGTAVVTFTAATADFRGDPSMGTVTQTPGPNVSCRTALPRTQHNDVALAGCTLVHPVYPFVYNATPYYYIKAETITSSVSY